MNLALLGYGRMGQEVQQQAEQRGHTITAVFDIDKPFTSSAKLNGAEAIISFTLADTVIPNLQAAAKLGIPIVEGTTGWLDRFGEAEAIDGLTLVYSPNFSIGVYVFTQAVREAARLMAPLDEYDCYLHEWHHTGKVDSPSGTAVRLADVLLAELPQKQKALYETSHEKIDPKHLHVTSTRVGRVPGTHQVGFDGEVDSIELKHTAHGRQGFALGAVRAAEWVAGKTGIFSMDDFMQSLQS